MFTMPSKRQHMERRQIFGSIYSRTNIQNSALLDRLLQSKVDGNWQSKLNALAKSQEVVDVHRMNKAILVDLTTAWIFGDGQLTDLLRDDTDAEYHSDLFQGLPAGYSLRGEFLSLKSFSNIKNWPIAPTSFASQGALQTWFSGLCGKALQVKTLQTTEPHENDGKMQETAFALLQKDLQHSSSSEQSARMTLEAELLDHVLAGYDVTGIALTYLMYSLSQYPLVQSALQAEIQNSRQMNVAQTLTAQHIDALPLLHAVVMETLRLYSPNPGPWPRVVPSSGCTIGEDQYIPPRTVITASSYVLHRNFRVFPEPEKWKPERWLGAETNQRKEMEKWMWAFGSGTRKCIGNDLAMRSE